MAGDDVEEMTDVRELASFARDRIGLKPALAVPKIEALLRSMPADRRRAFCHGLLGSSPDAQAWQAFTEVLLVHETYFFRYPDQLRLLAEVLLPRLLQDRLDTGSREVRIWSAGCSSGEEVYTIAHLLQSAIASSALPSLRAWNVTILGTDLSAQALELARGGTYALGAGLDGFRDVPEFAQRHFATVLPAAGITWSANAELRSLTQFARHNLVTDPPALRDADLIICRNTLIYFEEEQTRSALASLEAALRPAGALFLGPAETVCDGTYLGMVCAEQAVFWTKEGTG